MNELLKAFKHFITRDIIFIIGGAIVIISILYSFDKLPQSDLNIAYYLLGAGISYIIGYTLQDISCLFPGFTTKPRSSPNKLQKWLYKRFCRIKWTTPKKNNKDYFEIPEKIKNERMLAEFDRVINLMLIGTVTCPCFFISFIFLFFRWKCNCNKTNSGFDLLLFVAAIFISICQWILSNLKSMQYATLCDKFFKAESAKIEG